MSYKIDSTTYACNLLIDNARFTQGGAYYAGSYSVIQAGILPIYQIDWHITSAYTTSQTGWVTVATGLPKPKIDTSGYTTTATGIYDNVSNQDLLVRVNDRGELQFKHSNLSGQQTLNGCLMYLSSN